MAAHARCRWRRSPLPSPSRTFPLRPSPPFLFRGVPPRSARPVADAVRSGRRRMDLHQDGPGHVRDDRPAGIDAPVHDRRHVRLAVQPQRRTEPAQTTSDRPTNPRWYGSRLSPSPAGATWLATIAGPRPSWRGAHGAPGPPERRVSFRRLARPRQPHDREWEAALDAGEQRPGTAITAQIGPDVMVAEDADHRRMEGVAQERQPIGFEVPAADEEVELAEPFAVLVVLEGTDRARRTRRGYGWDGRHVERTARGPAT